VKAPAVSMDQTSDQSSSDQVKINKRPIDIEQKLEKLNDLLQKGLITKEEHSKKKQDLLEYL